MHGCTMPRMPLTPTDVAFLDERSRSIGMTIGWSLSFGEAPNPEFVFLTATTLDDDMAEHHVVVFGPRRVDEVTVLEVDLLLDELERGERRIVADQDGDPRLA